ncbi:hypothetical protein Tco_0930905 [Tanacetum coccineum]
MNGTNGDCKCSKDCWSNLRLRTILQTGQCLMPVEKDIMPRNCPKPNVHRSIFMEANVVGPKQDEAGGILTDEPE